MNIKKVLKIIIIFCINSPFTVYSKEIKTPMQSEEVWILVHGTFARQASQVVPRVGWWKEDQPFYKQLKNGLNKRKKPYSIMSFAWSGSLQHDKRVEAGKQLAEYIIKHTTPQQKIHIVAHSHGGNVALLAAGYLQEKNTNHKISHLYTLGTPIGPSYSGTTKDIEKIYNLFSYGDTVQSVLNLFSRIFDAADHIHNIQVRIDNSCPTHLQLHEACVASAITQLAHLIPDTKAYILLLFSDKNPLVTLDTTREEDLAIDKRFTMQLIMCFAESKKRGTQTATQLSEDVKTKIKDWLVRLRNRGNINTQSDDTTSC